MLLLDKAAQLNVAAASYNLGILALRPSNGAPDFVTAAQALQEAAEEGSDDALYSLGVLAKEGRGMPADPRSPSNFSAAAEGGNVDAMVETGIAFSMATASTRTRRRPRPGFAKAAEAGSPIARNRLARLYAAGQGVPPTRQGRRMELAGQGRRAASDPWLDDFMERQPEDVQDSAFGGTPAHGLARLPAPRSPLDSRGCESSLAPSDERPPMLRSPLMNVMVNAVLKAGKGLKRDFGELEQLCRSRSRGRATSSRSPTRRPSGRCIRTSRRRGPAMAS